MDKRDHILVLDDDPDIGVMMKIMLEHKGYAVTLFTMAEQTIDFLLDHSIDLVILDMLLSGTNGTDVCAYLKQNSATANLPILMVSALPAAKEICIQAGADDFIYKPFDMQDMLSKVRSLINNRQTILI